MTEQATLDDLGTDEDERGDEERRRGAVEAAAGEDDLSTHVRDGRLTAGDRRLLGVLYGRTAERMGEGVFSGGLFLRSRGRSVRALPVLPLGVSNMRRGSNQTMNRKVDPYLVECEECGLRAIRPSEEDAREIAKNHDSGECPEAANVEPRYS